jgi:hypothetical protein
MTTKSPGPRAGDEPLPRELAVSPAIGPLPPIHVAPPPRRTAVGLLRRVAASAARLAGGRATRYRYRNPAGD